MKEIIHTDRLYVRHLNYKDIKAFHEMQGDLAVMKYTTGHAQSYEESVLDLEQVISCYTKKENDFWVWAICLRETNEFVGTCAIVSSELGEGSEYEIGFRFLSKHWGNGFASEIINPLLELGYKVLDTSELVAYVDERNISSIKVLKKAKPVEESQILNPETGLPDLRFIYRIS